MIVLALLLSAAQPTPVPMPGEVESARFKAYFERGERLYQQGEYGAAVYCFKQADAQRVTPEVAYDLAKSYEKLGDSAFSIFYYRLYMKRAPAAPDTLTVAEQVGKALAKAEADNRGFLELDAPRASLVSVGPHRFPEPPVALFLPPGDYDVEATFPSGSKRMKVQIRRGQTSTVSFEPLRPPMLAMENSLPAELIAQGVHSDEPKSSKLRIGAYSVFGAGLVAVATGIVLGVMSSSDAAMARSGNLPLRQAQAYADAANAKAVVANALFIGGGAAMAGGVVMFVFSFPDSGSKK